MNRGQSSPDPAATSVPRLPVLADGKTDPESVRALRAFHFEGRGDAKPRTNGFKPALLAPYLAARAVRGAFPLLIAAGTQAEAAACEPLAEALETAAGTSTPSQLVADNLDRLLAAAQQALDGRSAPAPATDLLLEAAESTAREIELPETSREAFLTGVESLAAALPPDAVVLPLSPGAVLHLLATAATSRHARAVAAWRERAKGLIRDLRHELEIDARRRSGSRPEAVRDGLGQLGERFVDPQALASKLGTQRTAQPMTETRRRRVEEAVTLLESWEHSTDPRPILHCDATAAERFGLDELADGRPWRLEIHAEPLAAANATFEREAKALASVLAAARLAALELAGAYDPELHDPGLARFDWQAFDREELAMLPVVAAAVGGDEIEDQLPNWSRLLRSARPIQLLVAVDPAAGPPRDDSDGRSLAPELGYLGMGHREAFVHQGSLAAPGALYRAFSRALAGTRTALHVLALPPVSPAVSPLLAHGAALDGRAHPVFCFDPDAGRDWATRFDLGDNPALEDEWAKARLAVEGPSGEEELELAFTFADYALLTGAYAADFEPIGEEVASDVALDVAQWLELEPEKALHTIPFVWALAADGSMKRLAISRRLALECRSRLELWRSLQHLAGVHDPYVEAERERSRQEAQEQLDALRQQLEQEHARQLAEQETRLAREIVQRLVQGLVDGEAADGPLLAAAEGPAVAAAAPAPASVSSEPVAAPEASAGEEDGEPEAATEAPMEPWIDSALCTSCNDCIQINSQMFAYNEDKKAYIKDPRAGTFEQLVRAAEKCPASIIHPGTPLDPSEPNLDKLIQRAEPFQ